MEVKYPVYIISKGRHDCCLTADFMLKDGVDFKIVVEPQERELYAEIYGDDRLLILPFSNLGLGSIPARNWVWEHSISIGAERHWIFDDNIRSIRRHYKGKRLKCDATIALAAIEDFTDRYENIGIAGMNYLFFALPRIQYQYFLNTHVYSNLLIKNDMEYRWRGRYNEDTDLCLQVLTGGLCTVAFNAFVIEKMRTMTMKGGNSTELYKGDGRLVMSRSLERVWPGVVRTDRRFGRPQHKVHNEWKDFDNALIRRTDIDWDEIKNKKWDIKLTQVGDTQSEELKKFYEEYNRGNE